MEAKCQPLQETKKTQIMCDVRIDNKGNPIIFNEYSVGKLTRCGKVYLRKAFVANWHMLDWVIGLCEDHMHLADKYSNYNGDGGATVKYITTYTFREIDYVENATKWRNARLGI